MLLITSHKKCNPGVIKKYSTFVAYTYLRQNNEKAENP